MLPSLETAEVLPGPYEFLEMTHAQTITITPEKWAVGKARIVTERAPAGKEAIVLRVWLSHEQKPTLPHYWDITSQHLVAGLLGYLDGPTKKAWRFTITKDGVGVKARFMLRAE